MEFSFVDSVETERDLDSALARRIISALESIESRSLLVGVMSKITFESANEIRSSPRVISEN
jgi:hypothetical protein